MCPDVKKLVMDSDEYNSGEDQDYEYNSDEYHDDDGEFLVDDEWTEEVDEPVLASDSIKEVRLVLSSQFFLHPVVSLDLHEQ